MSGVRAKRMGSWAGAGYRKSAAAASVQSERQSMGAPEVKKSINVVVKRRGARRRHLSPSLIHHTLFIRRTSKGIEAKVTFSLHFPAFPRFRAVAHGKSGPMHHYLLTSQPRRTDSCVGANRRKFPCDNALKLDENCYAC